NINLLRVLWIKNHVIQDIVVARSEVSKTSPTAPAVAGGKQSTGTRAQKNVIGVGRIVGQAANITALRTQSRPLAGPGDSRRQSSYGHNNQQLTRNSRHSQVIHRF